MSEVTHSSTSKPEHSNPSRTGVAEEPPLSAPITTAGSAFPQSDKYVPNICVHSDRLQIAGVELPRAVIADTLSDLKHMLEVLSALKADNVNPTAMIEEMARKVDAENIIPDYGRISARAEELLTTIQAPEAHIYQRTNHWLRLLERGGNPCLQTGDIQDFVTLLYDGLAISLFSDYVDRALLVPFSGCTSRTVAWMSLKAYLSSEAAVQCRHLYSPLFRPAFPDFVGGQFQYLINRICPTPHDQNPDSMLGLMHLVAASEVGANVPAPRADIGKGKLNIHLGSDEVVTCVGTIKTTIPAEEFLSSFPLVEPLREIFFNAL